MDKRKRIEFLPSCEDLHSLVSEQRHIRKQKLDHGLRAKDLDHLIVQLAIPLLEEEFLQRRLLADLLKVFVTNFDAAPSPNLDDLFCFIAADLRSFFL